MNGMFIESVFTCAKKRRRRDLNPRAGQIRPTALAGPPLQPLEYFPKNINFKKWA